MPTIDNIQEIKSLISLMDDPDELVFNSVEKEIVARGAVMIPWLEEARAKSSDPLMQTRIERTIHLLRFKNTRERLSKWVAMGQDNLLLGAIIIAKYQYPDLKEESIIRRLGHITQDIYLRIKDDMSPMEKVQIINTVLFEEYEFYGNKRDYQSPQCYYLNMVFDTGKGNHLSLGMIYLLVASSLGVPIVGVDLHEYFFLAYSEEENMLFFINPFSRGNTLSQSELLFFLKLAEVDIKKGQIEPADNLTIIRKLIAGLADSYEKLHKEEKVRELNELLAITKVVH